MSDENSTVQNIGHSQPCNDSPDSQPADVATVTIENQVPQNSKVTDERVESEKNFNTSQVKPSCTYLQDTCKKSKKRARSMPSCKNTVLQDLQ